METELAIIEQKILNTAKAELTDLLSYSPDIPEHFTVGNQAYMRHKFRANWFQGVISNVKLVADILNNDELMRAAKELETRIITRKESKTEDRTTAEEIEQADKLINQALALLV